MFLIEFLIKPRGSITTEGSGKGHTWVAMMSSSVDTTKIRFGYIREDDHPNV